MSHCESIKVALDGAEQHNSTIVVVKQKCKSVPIADAPDGTPCSTWFLPDSSANGTCRCGNDIDGAVSCNDFTKEVSILGSYCMTYNESTGSVVGACFYNHMCQTSVPSNTTEVNMCMCGFFNRAGQLCGKCEQNQCIPVYSYDMKCVQCSVGFGWVKYILAAFLPLTVFFILILSCRLSATSPQLSTFLLFSQLISMPADVRIALTVMESYPFAEISARVILSIYGIWNLDFFRTLIPHICVSVNIDNFCLYLWQ